MISINESSWEFMTTSVDVPIMECESRGYSKVIWCSFWLNVEFYIASILKLSLSWDTQDRR